MSHDTHGAVQAFEGVLDEIEDYLENRQDIVDGSHGEQRPNAAMSLLTELRWWRGPAMNAMRSEKAMSKIVEASAPQIEEAARNMAKAAVIGVGVGPLPSALSAEVRRFQGGLTNAQLAEAWEKKLPGVTPTDRELSAFAIGIEVGETLTRSATAAISFSDIEQIINARIARLEAHTDPAGNVTGPDFNVCEIEQLRGVLAEVKEKLRRSDSGKADK